MTSKNQFPIIWQKAYKNIAWASAPADALADTIGGYTDWRVPTVKELYSLVKFNGKTGTADPSSNAVPADSVPYMDIMAFSFGYNTTSTARYIDVQYVTTTSYVSTVMNSQSAFFGFNFVDGRIKGYPQAGNPASGDYFARYVRGNTNYGTNSFTENTDATIKDSATGLTWMKVDSGSSTVSSSVSSFTKTDGSLNWSEALSFCENLSYASKSDWRLPNAKELHSIVDYSRSPDTTSSAAIDSIFTTTSITDPGGSADYPFFWSSTTHLDGLTEGEWAVYIAFGEAEGYFSAATP